MHATLTSQFRAVNLEALTVDTGMTALWAPSELERIAERHGAVASETFVRLRAEELSEGWRKVTDNREVTLESARPYFTRRTGFAFYLKFATLSTWAGTDGGWSGYMISEEVPRGELPARLAPFTWPPREVTNLLGRAMLASVGWSEVQADHPMSGELDAMVRGGR